MKIERKIIENGILRVTTSDERWYGIPQEDGSIRYVPSVTWICEHYPKGIGFYKWLASKGWDEAMALKEAAGDRGSTVHNAVVAMLKGETIRHDSAFTDETGKQREITTEEYEGVISFADWWKENKPELIIFDKTVIAPDFSYAGTLDLLYKIKGEAWLIDLKTSSEIWPSHELQISAYGHCFNEPLKLGILQLGYKRNKKKKFKFTDIENQYELFEAAMKIWKKETSGIIPQQKDFPAEVKL